MSTFTIKEYDEAPAPQEATFLDLVYIYCIFRKDLLLQT
ncbi:hypothetical protein M2454_001796 [Aequitasia blattaphilus]